ncbi:hypothetical protein L6R50_14355 [Myxococcota bacterium]|nr:hypothetical protein [Myxococcota bacterium]
MDANRPVRAAVVYAPEDRDAREALRSRLDDLVRGGKLELADGGEDAVDGALAGADLVVVLASAHGLARARALGEALDEVEARLEAGRAWILPVLVEDVDLDGVAWRSTPLGRVPVFPRNLQAVSAQRSSHAAWEEVAREVRRLVVDRWDGATWRPLPRSLAMALRADADGPYMRQLLHLVAARETALEAGADPTDAEAALESLREEWRLRAKTEAGGSRIRWRLLFYVVLLAAVFAVWGWARKG